MTKDNPSKSTVNLDTYKTVMCKAKQTNGRCNNLNKCQHAHARRELRRKVIVSADGQYNYYPKRCDYENRCPEKDKCTFSHTTNEIMYHPQLYKSKECSKISSKGGCKKGMFCPFIHPEKVDRETDHIIDPTLQDTLDDMEKNLSKPTWFALTLEQR
uniref:C3H1-type domain-containing protein n=1 Tax=viral metagenome TaxID=1070528 RepID=A0A6C0CLF8_9ZZZZ